MTLKYKVLHNTSVSQAEQSIQRYAVERYHKEQFNMLSSLGYYTGYNWLIDVNGTAIQCRADGEETVAVFGHNFDSIHICFAGNGDKELPNDKQVIALRKLDKQYKDLEWRFHRELQENRTCPGKLITHEVLKDLLAPKDFTPLSIDNKKAEGILTATSSIDILLKELTDLRELVGQLTQFIVKLLTNK